MLVCKDTLSALLAALYCLLLGSVELIVTETLEAETEQSRV